MNIKFFNVKDEKYSETLFKINNDPLARKFSTNTKKISFKKHSIWLKKNLQNNKETIYLSVYKNKIIGLIRIKSLRKKKYLSWAIKNNFKGKGLGKRMLKTFVNKKKNEFFAKIKKNNIPSIKTCEHSGFKKYRENLKYKFYYKSK